MLLLPRNVKKTIHVVTAEATNRTWRRILWRQLVFLLK